jgi:hypothetical protein
VLDAVEASVVRRKWKAAKMQAKAKARAKKMNAVDMALQTTLVESIVDLDGEIKSFGESKQALRSFLQDQYKWRLWLRGGNFNTIPIVSEFRVKNKPYKLRMNPYFVPGQNMNTDK